MLFPYKQYDLIYVLTVGLLVSSLFSFNFFVVEGMRHLGEKND